MKTRVLELLQEPKNIQKDDLQILKDQIQEFPYLQNVRALHLYGVHLYESENYQKELSKTAAYTTDKKNLYHLINGKLEAKQAAVSLPKVSQITENKKPYPAYVPKNASFPLKRPEEKHETKAVIAEESQYTAVQPLPQVSNKPVEVEGQRNRILFEGEENFLNEDQTTKIDLESSMESGNLVTEKRSPNAKNRLDDLPVEETPEIKVAEDKNENVISEIIETESAQISDEIEADVNDSEVRNQEIHTLEPKTDEVEKTEINFNQSEIKVSPDQNLEQAVEAIVEDKAISFQEIAPLETEIREEAKQEETIIQDEVENQTDFTPETIIAEDKIESEDEKQKVEDDSQLSFHGTESFLPEVKIESKTPVQQEVPVENSTSKNKYEDEMRRLIEQVELKMKEAKKEINNNDKVAEKEAETVSSEISFAETQSFEVESESPKVVENEEETKVAEDEISVNHKENSAETDADSQSSETENKDEAAPSTAWKPMSFETNVLDSSIGKKAETVEQKPTEKSEPVIKEETEKTLQIEEADVENVEIQQDVAEISEGVEENLEEEEKTTPAFNVSFFGNNISSFIKSNQQEEPIQETEDEVEPEAAPQPKIQPDKREISSILDSNVPGFINTWQSWLKIDRTAELEKEKEIIKEKAIEAFIENNPKISQLKDESSFVVKERTDDISHLMTETLAKLYTEQKLYSKAIQAYQILIGKHPEKQSYFEERIQQVKDIRGR